jgi:hypothetical protein
VTSTRVPPGSAVSGPDRRPGRPGALVNRAAEEDRMRLVAALLVLGTLLGWMLFLEG